MTTGLDRIPARFEVLDDRFAGCGGDDWWEHHFDGGRWTEGPLYVPAGRYVLFSDIPNDRVLRWDEPTGRVSTFVHEANYANGRTLDGHGRVITCEQGTRRVVRVEHDGSTVVLADRYGGGRLNSPNDVITAGDGSVWFTDPTYGIKSDYEGFRAEPELDGRNVYRVSEDGSRIDIVANDFSQPNGLALSADETVLYVVDSDHDHIRRFDVGPSYVLTGGHVIAESTAGSFDGIRIDTADNIWAAAEDGVHCISPDGTLLGKIRLPEPVSNVAFGGPKRNRLFVTATRSLYSIMLNINGAAPVRSGRAAAVV